MWRAIAPSHPAAATSDGCCLAGSRRGHFASSGSNHRGFRNRVKVVTSPAWLNRRHAAAAVDPRLTGGDDAAVLARSPQALEGAFAKAIVSAPAPA
jgi:hypothetical protein